MTEYPVTNRNKAKRLGERATYDRAAVYEMLDSAVFCHIAYVIDGQPFCTPTMYWRKGNDVIWHGSAASRMLRAQSKSIDVCLTVSYLDSIVLTRSAFGHAVNYRSVMLFGRASVIDDPDERRVEARDLIDNFLPGRTARVVAPTEPEMKQVRFLKMPIDQASLKIRNHPASYETPEHRGHPVWAGEIMIETRVGRAEACPLLDPALKEATELEYYREGERLDDVLLRMRRGELER